MFCGAPVCSSDWASRRRRFRARRRGNRSLHRLHRLHRYVAAQQPDAGINARHPAFRWLSMACALDRLRRDTSDVIPLNARPCAQLSPVESAGEDPGFCPIYAKCEFHRASLDARGAKIWLATAASLVTTRVAPQLSAERALGRDDLPAQRPGNYRRGRPRANSARFGV